MKNSENKSTPCFWLVFSLVLNGYSSGLSGLSLGSVVLIVLVVCAILRATQKRKLYGDSVILFGAILSVTSFIGFIIATTTNTSINLPISSGAIGFAKFWLWVLMSSIAVREYYDSTELLKWLYRFAIILTTYLIVQNVAFYFAGIYLPNIFRIGPLQPYAEDYANYERLASGRILRAGSLLSESSFYGNFIICTLALYLERNVNDLKGKRLVSVIYMSIGVILCGSTSAIIIIALMFMLFYRHVNSNIRWQIGLLLSVAIIVVVIAWPQIIDTSLGTSLQYSFGKFSYLDQSSRFGKSFSYLSLIPQTWKLFGVGIGFDSIAVRSLSGSQSIYLNSMTSLIIQSGYIGVGLFVLFCIGLLKKSIEERKLAASCLIVAYVVKGIASGIYFSTYGVLFMFIIIGKLAEKESEE